MAYRIGQKVRLEDAPEEHPDFDDKQYEMTGEIVETTTQEEFPDKEFFVVRFPDGSEIVAHPDWLTDPEPDVWDSDTL